MLPSVNFATTGHSSLPGRVIVGFLMETAFLYYVSCCLFLLGSYSIMHSPLLPGGVLAKYCESYGIFLAYVMLLTAACLLVLRRLQLAEDGLVLAGMALLLILDPTSFNNLFYTYNLNVGLEVNTIAFIVSIGIYFVLMRIGGVPSTGRSVATTILAAVFVYFYPAGLNAGWAEPTVMTYFYGLWWIPLVLGLVCEKTIEEAALRKHATGGRARDTHEAASRSNSIGLTGQMRQTFLVASMLIVFCAALFHLLEARYAYSFTFHFEYLTPALLAGALLFFKLQPHPSSAGRQLIGIGTALAAGCSAFTEQPVLYLRLGIGLSTFNCGLGAAGLSFLYFWKRFRQRSWVATATVCLLFALSGPSLADAVFSICHFQFVPFLFLAIVCAAGSRKNRTPMFPTLAGGCLIISVLSLTAMSGHQKLVIFLQAWLAWAALVQWHFYQNRRQWAYSVAGASILCLAAMMFWVSSAGLLWSTDFIVVVVGVFVAGRALGNSFLMSVSLLGILAIPLYVARLQLGAIISRLGRVVGPGLLMMTLAFLLLPIAYLFSALKMRRRSKQEGPLPGASL